MSSAVMSPRAGQDCLSIFRLVTWLYLVTPCLGGSASCALEDRRSLQDSALRGSAS